jgi:hypothetical protein
MKYIEANMTKKIWRQPHLVFGGTTFLFIFLFWPLYEKLKVYLDHNYAIGSPIRWAFVTLYFGCFIWIEMVWLGCRWLRFINAIAFGALASVSVNLWELSLSTPLNGISKYDFLFVLIPLLLLLVVVEVAMLKREGDLPVVGRSDSDPLVAAGAGLRRE